MREGHEVSNVENTHRNLQTLIVGHMSTHARVESNIWFKYLVVSNPPDRSSSQAPETSLFLPPHPHNTGKMVSISVSSWEFLCQAINNQNQCLGRCFIVCIDSGATIGRLQEETYKVFPMDSRQYISRLNAASLHLWKLHEPLRLMATTDDAIVKEVINLQFLGLGCSDSGRELQPWEIISNCWDEEPSRGSLHLILRVQGQEAVAVASLVGTADTSTLGSECIIPYI